MNKPVVLILAALPNELDLNKANKTEWNKENLYNFSEALKKQIDPECHLDLDIRFTSVGKVNIALGCMDAIRDTELQVKNINYIINIGSAGSIDGNDFKIGDVVQCDYAMQTDLDLTGIGKNSIGTNQNDLNLSTDNKAFHSIDSKVTIDSTIYPKTICGSSDKFPIAYGDTWYNTQNTDGRSVSVLDQELGALAVAVSRENDKRTESSKEPISLISLKYISNQITKDQLQAGPESCKESGDEWLQNLQKSTDCQNKLLKGLGFVVTAIVEFESKSNIVA